MKTQIFRLLTAAIILNAAVGAINAQKTKAADKQIAVKIYLQKTSIDPSGATSLETAPVTRRVRADAPLRRTLEALFAPPSAREATRNFASSTLGTKFEGVTIENGTALVRFSEPPGDATAAIFIFIDAIERTAKQFAGVKRVRICAVGETLIDSEYSNPFPRCPAAK